MSSAARLPLVLLGVAAVSGACTQYVDATVLGTGSGTCTAASTDPDCAPTPWPTAGHTANSDPWLGTHNQVISVMNPNVLVLNFENGVTVAATTITAQAVAKALGEGSRYHAYSNTAAPMFLQYKILKVVDLTDNPPPVGWTNPSSTKVPTDATGAFDPTALFSQQFADLYKFADPKMPSRNLTLCELFETGVINELWIQDGEPQTSTTGQPNTRHAPYYQERKQVYDASGAKIPGSFEPAAGGAGAAGRSARLDVACNVTVRLGHIDPAVNPGCDEEVRGWGLEGMWAALPAYQADAAAFLNRDFVSRFSVTFPSWPALCDQVAGTCVTYPDPDTATGSAGGMPWTIHPFRQGCGDSEYPSNAGSRYDYGNPGAPTNLVNSRCAHFGLHDAPDGTDKYEPYSYANVSMEDAAFPGCGGGWQEYWRQSMPGYGNTAHRSDGQAMGNWWPMLFY